MPDPNDGPILVVDDDPDVREVFRLFLEAEGHRVTEAADGAEALRAIERDRPRLVVLDLSMPVMDGRELLRAMRARPGLADLPVLVVTAWPKHAASLPGLTGVVRKPVDVRTLAARIEERLARADPR